jgi:hypothetical protein
MTKAFIQAAMNVGGMCKIVTYINIGTSPPTLVAYRASADWSTIHVITQPNNWIVQATSADLNYVVANNSLFAYNTQTFTYDQQAYLGGGFLTTFNIRNMDGRIIVWAEETTDAANMTSQVGYPYFS